MPPLIAPLYGGKDAYAFLGMLIGRGDIEAQTWLQQQFGTLYGPDELTWRKAVQRGFQPGTSFGKAGALGSAAAPAFDSANAAAWAAGQPLEAVFRADSTLYDGRFANLGWLQELPDAMGDLPTHDWMVCIEVLEELARAGEAEARCAQLEAASDALADALPGLWLLFCGPESLPLLEAQLAKAEQQEQAARDQQALLVDLLAGQGQIRTFLAELSRAARATGVYK